MMSINNRPLIFDIKKFSREDGPGVRTTVFFKGCPLSCAWCHNPESQSSSAEVAFYPERCIACGDCESVCEYGAIKMGESGRKRIDREKCSTCGLCTWACPSGALKMIGEYYSLEKLIEILLADRNFYFTSGGGVTLSGGEPSLYIDYAGIIAEKLKKENIHTAIQTAGAFNLDPFITKLLPHIDLIFYDVKLMDPVEHRRWTGSSNGQILFNFAQLSLLAPEKLIPRTPLIPGVTDTEHNLDQISRFLKETGCRSTTFLPYNPPGKSLTGF